MALLLAKLLTALRVLLEAGVLWKALQRAGDDMQGFAESVPRTLRLFYWVIQVRALPGWGRVKLARRSGSRLAEQRGMCLALDAFSG